MPKFVVDIEKCDGCAACAMRCDNGAIEMKFRGESIDQYAEIDPEICTSCGECVKQCKKIVEV